MKITIDPNNKLLPAAAVVNPIIVITLIFDQLTVDALNQGMDRLTIKANTNCSDQNFLVKLLSFNSWQKILHQALFTIYYDKHTGSDKPNKELKQLQNAFIHYHRGHKLSKSAFQDASQILRALLKINPAHYTLLRPWEGIESDPPKKQYYQSMREVDQLLTDYRLCAALTEAAFTLNVAKVFPFSFKK